MKGASEIILGFCSKIHFWETNEVVDLTPEIRANVEVAIKTMAKASLRTITCAYKEIQGTEDLDAANDIGIRTVESTDLTLFCVLGIKDVLRDGVTEAVTACGSAGI